MGLLGIFLNKSFVKLVLIFAVIFLAIRSVESLALLVVAADPVALAIVFGIILCIITLITIRSERLKFLSGFMKLLLLAAVSLVLVFVVETSAAIPSPADLLLYIATLGCVSFTVYRWRKRILAPANPEFRQGFRERRRSLTRGDLLPKGIETGHVVFGAGRRGFRVLRFIEIELEQPHSTDKQVAIKRTHLNIARMLSTQLGTARRSGIEICYELCRDGGIPRIIVTSACEGRRYRECRAKVDGFTRTLSDNLDLSSTGALSVKAIDNNHDAQRVLLMPLLAVAQKLQRIESDGQSAKMIGPEESGMTRRLRVVRVLNLHPSDSDIKTCLLNELIRVALTTNPVQRFSCLLHIKPVTETKLNKEVERTREDYRSALERIVQKTQGELFIRKRRRAGLFARHDRTFADATSALKEAKAKLERLKEAESTGYFDVSLTMTGEPATTENMARTLKTRIFLSGGNARLSIVRLPPAMVQMAVRRDAMPFNDRLSGNELACLMIPRESRPRFSALNTADL